MSESENNNSIMGRPKINLAEIQLDGWKVLESLIIWTGEEYCAEQLGISVDTLVRRIKEEFNCTFAELKNKRFEKIRINLRKKQYDQAIGGNTSMLIWLGKNILGQADQVQAEVSANHIFNITVEEFQIDNEKG